MWHVCFTWHTTMTQWKIIAKLAPLQRDTNITLLLNPESASVPKRKDFCFNACFKAYINTAKNSSNQKHMNLMPKKPVFNLHLQVRSPKIQTNNYAWRLIKTEWIRSPTVEQTLTSRYAVQAARESLSDVWREIHWEGRPQSWSNQEGTQERKGWS